MNNYFRLFILVILLQSCIPYNADLFVKKPKQKEARIPALQPLRYTGDAEFAYSCYDVIFESNPATSKSNYQIRFDIDTFSKAKIFNELRKSLISTDELGNAISLNSYPKDIYYRNDQIVYQTIKNNITNYKLRNLQSMEFKIERIPADTTYNPSFNPKIYIQDVNTIFKGSLDKLMEKETDYKGYITYRFTQFERKAQYAWFVTSLISLFTINLVGFPLMQRKIDLCLEVSILNNEGKLIKKYNSCAKKSAFSAMYWGYSMSAAASTESQISTLQRAANAKAFSSALSNILKQIVKDLPDIKEQLQ